MDSDAYLERIGAPGATRLDVETLTTLIGRHLETVPFENLSVHLRMPRVYPPSPGAART